jgi:cysteinyl-tRNA synthetase
MTLEAMHELGDFYTKAFVKDLEHLHITLPHHMPKASEHIQEDIDLIQHLYDAGIVYPTSDGLYFDTATYSNYGKLGNIKIESLKEGARVESNPEKKHPADFAVWKFNPAFGWDAPWGKGFPGWHIECSAMAMKYLGETFDIHTGGIDHIPVHHNNEIAQSESFSHKQFVKYWLHTDFITIDNQKISKSTKNDIYLKDIIEKNINPLAYKYWLYTSHYQSQTNFTWDTLLGAEEAFNKLVRFITEHPEAFAVKSEISDEVMKSLYNNLNTPEAIGNIWSLIKNPDYSDVEKTGALLELDKVLGLNLKAEASKRNDVPEEIKELAQKREEARNNKDWKSSDELRNAIQQAGYEVKDTDSGPQILKNK